VPPGLVAEELAPADLIAEAETDAPVEVRAKKPPARRATSNGATPRKSARTTSKTASKTAAKRTSEAPLKSVKARAKSTAKKPAKTTKR
jgi:hypothetical protein